MKLWEWIDSPEQVNLVYEGVDSVSEIVATTKQKTWPLVAIFDKDTYFKTGELKEIWAVSKMEAHETGVFHGAGHLWIYNSKWEILLQKRKDDGLWDISVSGHIDQGEDMRTWTFRELKEETPIRDIEDKDSLEHIFDFVEDIEKIRDWKVLRNNEINSVFVLRYDKDIPNIQNEEVRELKFVPIEEYKKAIADPELSKEYLLQSFPWYYEKLFTHLKKVISWEK